MNYSLKQTKSLLTLVYEHILSGALCLAIYKQFCHEEEIANKFNHTEEANVFNLLADSMFKDSIFYITILFDGLNSDPRKKQNKKKVGFDFLEKHISNKNILNQLKKQNESRLSKPFDDIYRDFQSKIKLIKEGKNSLIKKIKKPRDKMMAHKEIHCSDTGEYVLRSQSYGISYEDVQDCMKFIFKLYNEASLLVKASETGWEYFQKQAEVIAKSFFKKLSQNDR